jgi:hypothetical protein
MLGWLGFSAKVLEFVLTKAAGRTIDLSLDRKHRAAKAFLRLYDTLSSSAILLDDLLPIFDQAVQKQKPVIFSQHLVPFENRITRLTEDLRRQYSELVGAIYIFDPKLATLLADVQGLKVQSLTAFGALLRKARFVIEFDGLHPFRRISFTTFRDEITNLDLAAITQASADPYGSAIPCRAANNLVEALSVLLIEDEFTASDFEKLRYLRDRLKVQAGLLNQVLPMLRDFIASNFTISDALGYHKPRS